MQTAVDTELPPQPVQPRTQTSTEHSFLVRRPSLIPHSLSNQSSIRSSHYRRISFRINPLYARVTIVVLAIRFISASISTCSSNTLPLLSRPLLPPSLPSKLVRIKWPDRKANMSCFIETAHIPGRCLLPLRPQLFCQPVLPLHQRVLAVLLLSVEHLWTVSRGAHLR
jgi:hypothetical protein